MADGNEKPNLGAKLVSYSTDDGGAQERCYQMADVARVINSISAICDTGCRVVFGAGGGFVYHMSTGAIEPIQRKGKLYIQNQWFKSQPKEAGFGRLGSTK